ncbi:nuclear transport factor 2 family protein [Algibacter sp.]|nr:nuclear transport factor 2 family protein [Algibacter sp.]MDA9069810.1 nuclear transport factor 2 family protein [Algibacter sp.]MDA9775234.1 nuclear transport factor 2 family protein [Algibacter sp.]
MIKKPRIIFFITTVFLVSISCQKKDSQMEVLMLAIEDYETAWSNNDFIKVESYFTADAKRLHTEPYVWDRTIIKEYFEERAANSVFDSLSSVKKDWKIGREYIDIRVEGNIAYDIFTTERFKALHIWEKQSDGSWKIKYDVGMLNYPE